jgi:hypothetical protein
MKHSQHALDQMALRAISREDVDAVITQPSKIAPGDDGCVNLWGRGPSGKRIRVTLSPDRTVIITVANADSRFLRK